MDTLKVGMRDELVWEVTEDLATARGDYKVFSTPGMTRFIEMTAHKLVGPHLKPGQGQVGLQLNIRHMAPTPIGKQVRCETELVAIDRRKLTFIDVSLIRNSGLVPSSPSASGEGRGEGLSVPIAIHYETLNKMKVYDEVEQIGEAEHDRYIVDLDKYMARLKAKIERTV